MSHDEFCAANRRNWDERVAIHRRDTRGAGLPPDVSSLSVAAYCRCGRRPAVRRVERFAGEPLTLEVTAKETEIPRSRSVAIQSDRTRHRSAWPSPPRRDQGASIRLDP